MDLRRNFTLSYQALMKNKIIVIPSVLVFILIILVAVTILFYSGIIDDYRQYSALKSQFMEEKGISEIDSSNPENLKEFAEYADATGFEWKNLKEALNFRNIVIFIITALILALICYYVSALSLALVALIATKNKWNWNNAIRLTNKIFLRYAWFHLLLFFLMILLAIAAGIIIFASALLMMVSKVLGIILMIAIGIFCLVIFFYVLIRLTFSTPYLFLENKIAYFTLKESFAMTKNRFKETFLVFLVCAGISIAFGILGNVVFSGFEALSGEFNTIQIVVYIIMIFVYYIISYFVAALSRLFLFYSYIDFKKKAKKLQFGKRV